jgi:ribosomal protein L35AE/L33A
MNKSILLIIILGIAIVVAGAVLLLVPAKVETEPDVVTNSSDSSSSGLLVGSNAIYVADQKPGDWVSISKIVLGDSGYVVIHEYKDGVPGSILGTSVVFNKGQSDGFRILLERATQEGESLFAMLHVDNGDGVFDPAKDAPVKNAQGDIIMMRFTISSTAEEAGIITL